MLHNMVFPNKWHFVSIYSLFIWAAATHSKHTFDALLPRFNSTLYTQVNCVSQAFAVGDLASGTVFKLVRTRDSGEEGEREKSNLNWSLVSLQTFLQDGYMVWSKAPHWHGSCSHERKPLMPLPSLPCWKTSPPHHRPPACLGLGAVTFLHKIKVPFYSVCFCRM